MRIGSLFSGAGGLDLAVEKVFGGHTVWHCEQDPAASQVLSLRWPGVPNLGDITAVDWHRVQWVNVLCGGFPCQDVSVGGKQAGIAPGTRSGLWTMFAAAIAALRPQFVVIENVRGLLSARAHRAMESGDPTLGEATDGPVLRAAGAVLGDLADLGYDAQWTTVSAASIGAPHKRERVFILATAADSARDGWDEGRPESARQQRRPDAAFGSDGPVELLPTPAASRSGRNRSASAGAAIRPSLDSITDLLPTPAARDGKGTNPNREGGLDLPGALLPTPSAADAERGPDFARAGRDGSGGDDLITLCARATRQIGARWGKYQPAIQRWESLTRPAPSPTELNTKGNPRLAPAFPEWMQGWADGWATAVPGISRNDQLRIIGNGVCPQQAVAALTWLRTVSEVAA